MLRLLKHDIISYKVGTLYRGHGKDKRRNSAVQGDSFGAECILGKLQGQGTRDG